MRNITRFLKAAALVAGSYAVGNIVGVLTILSLGGHFAGWTSVSGIVIGFVQGTAGVTVFETLVARFKHDTGFRFHVAAIMAWGLVGVELPVAVLHAWMFGVGLDDAMWLAASVVSSAPWCYWTTKSVLNSRRASLDLLAWSQRGLARLLGLDDRGVRRWASGQNEIPDDIAHWLVTPAAFHAEHPRP